MAKSLIGDGLFYPISITNCQDQQMATNYQGQ